MLNILSGQGNAKQIKILKSNSRKKTKIKCYDFTMTVNRKIQLFPNNVEDFKSKGR